MQALFALLLATNLCLAAPPEQQYSAQLLNPTMANATAPNVYKVKFKTTKGPFVVKVYRQWAPLGADRLYNLVQAGFYNEGIAFFRNINGFMVQFGIHGDPDIGDIWRGERIKDDPVVKSNTRKMVTFAMAGPNTRTTQVFINFADKNQMLDGQGFAPLGKVTGGMK
ncbi:MAG: peptidylprolyl isomerase, partial [Proteobacteria bacterium]|nr:peptidylprolyl isomerase [Pseudomonadota bacterium]